MSNKSVVVFKNVSKKFRLYPNDKQRLLDFLLGHRFKIRHKLKVANKDLSFSVNHGESVAFFGRNGAGKSTLLKIITGVTYPDSGTVHVEGRVGALLEITAGFDGEFTGRENIYLKGMLLGLSTPEIDERVAEIISFAELDEYIDQPVRTYSSGMKARLGFSIHAHTDPDIFIIDEALSVGDMKFQEKCKKKTQEIIARDHVTVLLVTHSLESAKQFCQRGIVLKDGQIISDASIDKAIADYKASL